MTREDVAAALQPILRRQLQRFIVERMFLDELGVDEDLLQVVDSLGMLEVVSFVESDLGCRVPREHITPQAFGTVRRIASYVARHRRL